MIQAETATVYRAENGRRYLTKRSAIMATARRRVRNKYPCDCEPVDVGARYPGYDCGNHGDRYDTIVWRYARILVRAQRAAERAVRGTP